MNKKTKIIIAAIAAVVVVVVAGLLIFFLTRSNSSNDSSSSSPDRTTESSTMSQADLNKLDLPQLSNTVASDEAEVRLETTAGNIDIKLFPKLAPLAVQNFLTLAKQGYYKDNEFFRVINNFMIQTGDPSNTGTGSTSVVNDNQPFSTEISNRLYNIRGAVSLANTGQPDSSSSQFFIVQNSQNMTGQISDTSKYPQKILDAYAHGGYPSLDGGYTVFGQVISGMDIVDKIASAQVQTNSQSGEASSPVHPEKITGVTILKDWKFKK
ncbi:peptidylprolyl isomerase [Lactococcus nasutitermitis]|uniref:Peptidyl-prolyl cis-trans isomerase n=1 Tax=Lactococcus nasutitermitis TaxID=1652957 RepID=A0ABV9J9D3_9LACT|nr:peptidylprolyl isomerase [Lactococcus nasutitermitis]